VPANDAQARKGAENQALLREVNERIEQLTRDVSELEIVCECANTGCIETIQLSVGEYEAIRSSPVRFPIIPGHEFPEIEYVVETNERYAVVEKIGEAAESARELDRRSSA